MRGAITPRETVTCGFLQGNPSDHSPENADSVVGKHLFLVGFIDRDWHRRPGADGASVNGVRRSLTCSWNSVASLPRQLCNHRQLVHCSAHRLQLSAADAFSGDYLKDMEKRTAALLQHLHEHPTDENRFAILVRGACSTKGCF